MAVENKKDKIKSDVPVQKEGYKSLLEMGPLILFLWLIIFMEYLLEQLFLWSVLLSH